MGEPASTDAGEKGASYRSKVNPAAVRRESTPQSGAVQRCRGKRPEVSDDDETAVCIPPRRPARLASAAPTCTVPTGAAARGPGCDTAFRLDPAPRRLCHGDARSGANRLTAGATRGDGTDPGGRGAAGRERRSPGHDARAQGTAREAAPAIGDPAPDVGFSHTEPGSSGRRPDDVTIVGANRARAIIVGP